MSDTARPKRRRGRKVTVVSSAAIAVVALVLTGFALRFPGLSSSDVDVSNGGVWVTSEQEGLLGRLNVDAGELDARLASTGQDLDIIQSGYHVIETGPRGMTPINTASVTRNGLVELPPDSEVVIGKDRVAISSPDGRVWILSPEEAAAFDASAVEPVLEGSSGPLPVAVSTEGTVFVLNGGELLTYPREADTRDTTAKKPDDVGNVSQKPESLQLAAIGEKPVILDREKRLLRVGTDVKDYDLVDYGVSSLDDAQLQQSGPASEDFVVATADSLFVIPFDGGKAEVIQAGGTGTDVVRPAQVQGCSYGAWGGSLRYVKSCEGAEDEIETIPEADGAADLTLRVNHDLVVLNDQKFGLSWNIMDSMQVVDDWEISQEIQKSDSEEEKEETLTTTITNVAAERDEENRQPTANDDTFGVRPGKSIVLPVTRNDTDPDGDVLSVALEGAQPGIGTVAAISGGTQLQIEVDEDASGSASFTYEVDDGRGGKDTASVTLEVRGDAESEGPREAEDTTTKVQVRSGEEVSFNILPYWEDPDGDAFYLANATVAPEDVVSFRPDGHITFNDAGLSPGTKQVQLTFRDEKGTVGEGVVEIESVTDSDLVPITTADHASIVAGRTTTIKPLANDLNPNGGNLELISVSDVEGLEVDPVTDAGTINVEGSTPGVYYLEYTVGASGASSSSLGLIRIDVVEPDSEELEPVAVDDMGTVITGTDTLIDPLENDVDPTGGVLVVNSIDVPADSGLKATVVNHHLIRVEAAPGATVGEEPIPVTYEVANSAGSSTGTVRVMVTSTDTQFANPEAVPDRAVVRAGDMVNIDVLANDTSPTGADLQLAGELDTSRAEDQGHTEPHQDQVRFSADDDASGEAVVQYQVIDETGRTGSAPVHITIVPQETENSAPRPDNLTARTVAGTPVRIPVSTTGIDPDGDSVMLTGVTSPMPTLGEVVSANGEWIEYLPYEDSLGTDRFRYQVMDRHGAIGTAEVLVGVAAPNDRNQAPYAVDDIVEVRPDREVQIPVLDNDTDPEGDPLSVVRDDVDPMTEIEYKAPPEDADDGYVTVVTPSEAGTHTVVYAASDGQLKSSATATIKVAGNAPLRAPIARDDFVAVEDVLDTENVTIDVDVLANDSDPDGSTSDLEVALEDSSDGAELLEDGETVRVVPQEEQQRIRYSITDADGLDSAGYIWVPGTAKQAPVWVGEPLEVQAGSEGTIELDDPNNVRVRPGAQPAQVTDPAGVTAPHSDGGDLVADATTLVYRPAADFSGNDTITVEVTDGEVGDATAATATLAIPVVVEPEETNLPPTLKGALLEVEQGGARSTVDLAAGAEDPEGDELSYELGSVDEHPEVSIGLEGSTLSAEASARSTKGEIINVPVTVTDGTNPAVSATVQVTVGASQRPLISAVRDEETIDAGTSETLKVLENDSNPFPGGSRTITGAALTAGKGEVDFDDGSVTITPDEDMKGILTANYTVQDDTGDPEREVTGEIRVTVLGKPESPSAPRIGEVGDGFVELNFTAGDDNGAPIEGYEVISASGPSVTQSCESTSCTITDLTNDTEYTFQVVAKNRVGDSTPSVPSAVARPDVRPEKPDAPSAERGDEQLTVSWSPPVNRGSAIRSYTVQIQNTATEELQSTSVEGGSTQTVFSGLTNGVDYRFRVQAENLADEPSDWSDWSSPEHPAGRPAAPSGTATAERIDDPVGGGVTVTWPKMTDEEANGEPITEYIVTSSSGKSQTVPASKTTATFRDLDRDSKHTFTYKGVNSVGKGVGDSKASNAVVPWAKPSTPGGVKASMPSEGEGDGPNGRATVSWNAADGNGTSVTKYVVRWNGGSKTVDAPATSVKIDGLKNGTAYRFTVEAHNGHAADGGVSERSKQTDSITPYTKPAKPTVSSSNGKCTGESKCPVTVKANAGGGDGGAGGKTLQVRIDGGSWQDAGTSYSKTFQKKSQGSVKIEARVVNAKGLTSGAASTTQKAQKWTPPQPKSSVKWGEKATNDVCYTQHCRKVDIRLTNLEPGKTYDLTLFTRKSDTHGGGDWVINGKKVVKAKADANGNYSTTGAGYDLHYGYPDNEFEVKVNGKITSVHSLP
ncbi:Ig-like domain-containing protein [Brachybacterium sp. AOP43-C2-M15]|uniref:Ig-like domain-containing protein n=1 Tax=Brachybacterium sp. AOP43-C2-M15 TaxID=3457661 RepID=UPI004033FD2E